MSKPAENKFYKETLLTLNANSSDDYVKSIYDGIAEQYDKVLYTSFEVYFLWLGCADKASRTSKHLFLLRIK